MRLERLSRVLCLFVSSPERIKRLSKTGYVVCVESDKAENIVEDWLYD